MADQFQIKKRPQRPKFDPRKRKNPRVASFKKPKPGFFRRILRIVFHPVTVGLAILIVLGVFLTATYFWFAFSERVDGLLRGDVFTRSAGVYSAPKTLKTGENITPDVLAGYLKS